MIFQVKIQITRVAHTWKRDAEDNNSMQIPLPQNVTFQVRSALSRMQCNSKCNVFEQ